jgi:hypothetical protein
MDESTNKLELLKDILINSIIPGPIIDPDDFSVQADKFIYVPEGNHYAKYKIEKVEDIDINPSIIYKIKEIETLDSLKQFADMNLNKKIMNDIKKVLQNIYKLEEKETQYQDIIPKNNKYYLKKMPKTTIKNINNLKQIVLFYELSITDTSKYEYDHIENTNKSYNEIKNIEINEMDETTDIFETIWNLNDLINS